MNNNIINILKNLEARYLKDIDINDSISLKRKDYSRAVINAHLEASLKINPDDYLKKVGLTLKTTPISHGSLISVEPLRLCSLRLKNFTTEAWEDCELNTVLKGILILPLIVEAKNLGQAYRKVGSVFMWIPSEDEVDEIRKEWLWFQEFAKKGAIPKKRGVISNGLTFPTEATSKYIHMKPHSVKGKFETDAFGNQVRKMAFYLNPPYLRNLILNTVSD